MDIQDIKNRFGIIGNSPFLNRAIDIARQVAPTDISVLITGESGSGKEVFSHIIHALSARKHGPFIAVNCGAIPEGTIDSELFGHEKGSFTGAHDVLVPVAVNIATGYIVCDVELVVAKNISNTIFKVAMSSVANQVAVGVMVLNNGLLANAQPAAFVERVDWIEIDGNMQNTTVMRPEYEAVKDLYNYCAANAVGEGQVYVCGESGNISSGDLIVTSSVAGVGMKQSDNIVRNITVAKARQAITFTDLTTPVLVACIYLCG